MNEPQAGRREFQIPTLINDGTSIEQTYNENGHAMILNEYGWLWLNRDAPRHY